MVEGSKNISLIGFMGTGKTSVGKLLGKTLSRQVIDVDQYLETSQGRKIADIFEKDGEDVFRSLEKKAISEVSKKQGVVITTGGGAVLDPENMEALKKSGWVICLSASPETIFGRVKHSRHRPLLEGKEDRLAQIRHLLREREPFYAKADMTFETDGQSSPKIAERIVNALKERLA